MGLTKFSVRSQSLTPEPNENKSAHQSGSVVSSAALVAGTTVGAGVLALPAVTYPVGVIPSTVLMVAAWLYMLASGLLVAEANLRAMRVSGRADLGLLATIEQSLGKVGAIAAGILYIFIHYALLVAYVARGGDILASALEAVEGGFGFAWPVPLWLGHVAFVILLGGILYAGTARLVERLNGALVALVIVAFGALLALTVSQVDPARFQVQHWEAVGLAVPVMFVAFVYQNVVPVVTTQLEGDGRRVRRAIVLGSVVPLVMFALWNAVILGNTTWGEGSVLGDGVDPIELMRLGAGYSQLGVVVSVFSEFAIATSFIGFVFGLLNVFEDIFSGLGESVEAFKSYRRLLFYGLVLMPPLALSVIDPNIFFEAIDIAGAYGNSILFGIIPAVMVWQLRYQKGGALTVPSADQSFALVPGGRGLLVTMVGIAVAVIAQNVMLK
ncbi:MAG: aromatic amino acid transport family protein [Cyanobacteria bacterium P01_D01_bin.36]